MNVSNVVLAIYHCTQMRTYSWQVSRIDASNSIITLMMYVIDSVFDMFLL